MSGTDGDFTLRYFGHAAVELSDGTHAVIIDPFLSENPKSTHEPHEVEPDTIVLTHGHPDHLGDAVAIAKRTGAAVLAIGELARELAGELGEAHEVIGFNLGGTVERPWGWVRLVPAWHTAVSAKGTPHTPAGVVVEIGGKTVYHLGDTALFSDLALVSKRTPIDIALIPIGGHFTMDRHDAVEAAKLIGAETVVPIHYDTWPPVESDPDAFKADVERETDSSVVVLKPGETLSG